MKKDFKLIGYYVETEYNDYTRDNYVLLNTNEKIVIKSIEEKLLKNENCDKFYFYNIKEIYLIENTEYYKFGFYKEIEEFGKKILIGEDNYYIMNSESKNFKLETPVNKIPKNEIVLKKINEIQIVDSNGIIIIENIKQQMELLQQLILNK